MQGLIYKLKPKSNGPPKNSFPCTSEIKFMIVDKARHIATHSITIFGHLTMLVAILIEHPGDSCAFRTGPEDPETQRQVIELLGCFVIGFF